MRKVVSRWLSSQGEVGYNLHLLSDYSQTFHLYGGVSALGGYETVNWGKQLLPDGSIIQAEDAFIYGGAVTLSADIYLSDHVALGAHIKEQFVFGNDTGHFCSPMAYTSNTSFSLCGTQRMTSRTYR